MGDSKSDVFRRHYMSRAVKFDTLIAYLGTLNRADIIKTMGIMSARRNPRAPVGLSSEVLDQIFQKDLELLESVNRRMKLAKEIRAEFPYLKNARAQRDEKVLGKLT